MNIKKMVTNVRKIATDVKKSLTKIVDEHIEKC